MKIEPFVYQWSPAGTIALSIGLLLGSALIAQAVVSHRRNKKRPESERGGSFDDFAVTAFPILAILPIFFGALSGGLTDESNEVRAREAHYTIEAERVMTAYPQLKDSGIQLSYDAVTGVAGDSGNFAAVIQHQGKFEPIGTAYERTADGLDRSNLVAILNDDWTLEIFEARDPDELVKIEPQGVAQ